MNTQLKRYTKAYVLAFAVTALAPLGGEANAQWTRTHAYDCEPLQGKALPGGVSDGAIAVYNNGQFSMTLQPKIWP